MHMRTLDPNELKAEYDVLCQDLLPWHGVAESPVQAAWIVVPPGAVSQRHGHHDFECFFVMDGRGSVLLDGDDREVGPGDVVLVPPFTAHTITNHGDVEFRYLTLAWEDMAVLDHAQLRIRAPRARLRSWAWSSAAMFSQASVR